MPGVFQIIFPEEDIDFSVQKEGLPRLPQSQPIRETWGNGGGGTGGAVARPRQCLRLHTPQAVGSGTDMSPHRRED